MRRGNLCKTLLLLVCLFMLLPYRLAKAGLNSQIWLDEPSTYTINNSDIYVGGWALNPSGVKEVNIYVDGILIGKAETGVARPDVNEAYPGYPGGAESGFKYSINKDKVSLGTHNLKVEAVGNDGSVKSYERKLSFQKPASLGWIDAPGSIIDNKDFTVSGWVLNPSGIKEVNILVDGKLQGKAQIGIQRLDVGAAFKSYQYGDQSGYLYNISINTIAAGTHTLRIQAVGNDGGIYNMDKQIEVRKPIMQGCIDEPVKTTHTSDVFIRGWALNPTGVKEIKVYADNILKGSAEIGLPRADVNQAFPGYPDGDKSGYQYTLDFKSLTAGNHALKLDVIGNDGSVYYMYKTIEAVKPTAKLCIDTPSTNKANVVEDIYISGWALNPSGMQQIKLYADGVYLGDAEIGIPRPDVNAAYPGYIEGENSGFKYTIPANTLALGNRKITIEAIGKDGAKQLVDKYLSVEMLPGRLWVDSPAGIFESKGEIRVAGWALHGSGVKEVNVYIDGVFSGNANYGGLRSDVAAAFPEYRNGDKSAYSYSIDSSLIPSGKHSVKINVVGNDGSITSATTVFELRKLPARLCIDEPYSSLIIEDEAINVSGWALNASGMNNMKVYLDGVLNGEAVLGIARADVNAAYPGYPGGELSGFSYKLNVKLVKQGLHTIKLVAFGKDGSAITVERSFQLRRVLPPIGTIDFPVPGGVLKQNDTQISIGGWALNNSGVKEIKVFLNGQYKGNAEIGLPRADVNAAYPKYQNSLNSGYSYALDVTGLASGKHNVMLQVIGNDGEILELSTWLRKGRIIVIDPGHNYGGNDGAYAYHNGITYVERDLNMQVAVKLKQSLEALGFQIIMTRTPFDITYESSADSLAKRVSIANNSGADLFISIHHDSSISSSAKGVSTHWSSYRPNIESDGIYTISDITYDSTPSAPAVMSREFANLLVNNLAGLGYTNRGSLDHNLYVTKNTVMTSVLVECGFISNAEEAARSADSNNQWRIAESMANSVNSFFSKY